MAGPSMPLETAQEAEVEVLELDPDCVDVAIRSTSPATSASDQGFVEELLQDAYLPRDGKP